MLSKPKAIHGLIVWFIATLFVVYSFSLNSAGAVFSEAIKTSLHISNLSVSFATAAFIAGFALMLIPGGYLLDRFNARFVISAALLLLMLGNVAISYATNIYLYALANLIQGMGGSFGFIGASILIAQWFPAKMFPILMGFVETLVFIGAGVVHYILVIALETYSWGHIYRYFALCGFVLFILTVLIVKTPSDYQFAKQISFRTSLKEVFGKKQVWLCAIAAATSFGVMLAYGGLWYLPIQQYYSVKNSTAVLIGSMVFFGIGVGTPVMGWLSNRVKSRKLILHFALVLGNMGLIMAIYLPHFLINNYLIIKTVSFITGFLLSGSMLFYTIVSELSSNSTRGLAISLTSTCVFIFNTFLLIIPYALATTTSTQFFTYLWVLPFCITISILLTYFIRETYSLDNKDA